MSAAAAKVLFVPVSGPSGMGEFARARSIADALVARWPGVETHFVLHRDAPYARGFHHPATLVPASPTLCTDEVVEVIRRFRPGVACFDNAGRTGALRAARGVGARVIYVSSRGRQRYKAFRLRWMRLLDAHWISYPELVAGAPSPLERLKMRVLGRPEVRFLDAVLPAPDDVSADRLLDGLGDPDVLVVPGGGSQFHDSAMTPAQFGRWGVALAERGRRVVFVAGPSFTAELGTLPSLRLLRGVGGAALMALLRRSALVLVNGGDTLLQALALGRPCVAVPIAGDQAQRIARCAALGGVLAPEVRGVEAACESLLADPAARLALQGRADALGLHDAMPGVVATIGDWLGLDASAAAGTTPVVPGRR